MEWLANLQGHKAHGPDGIPARLLKETAYSMAPLPTHIYKASLHQCKLPHDWKTALVSPIYKKNYARVLQIIDLVYL